MAEISVKLKPWSVPEEVIVDMPPGLKQDGMVPLPRFKLCDISLDAMNDMIKEFEHNVRALRERQRSAKNASTNAAIMGIDR